MENTTLKLTAIYLMIFIHSDSQPFTRLGMSLKNYSYLQEEILDTIKNKRILYYDEWENIMSEHLLTNQEINSAVVSE